MQIFLSSRNCKSRYRLYSPDESISGLAWSLLAQGFGKRDPVTRTALSPHGFQPDPREHQKLAMADALAGVKRTELIDNERPPAGGVYARCSLRATLAMLYAAVWDETCEPSLASLQTVAAGMGAAHAGLDADSIKRNICAVFRDELAPSGDEYDALAAREYDTAAFKTDVRRLHRLDGDALKSAVLGLIMWAPPTSAIDEMNWDAINEASVARILARADGELRMDAQMYLADCLDERRPGPGGRALADDDVRAVRNAELAAALATGIVAAQAGSEAGKGKKMVQSEEAARAICVEPFAAGACATLWKFGTNEDGTLIPLAELKAAAAECTAILKQAHGPAPRFDSSKGSVKEHEAAEEAFYRVKFHETIAPVAAAKRELARALIDQSVAIKAAADWDGPDEGQHAVRLRACVAAAAAVAADARAYAADAELMIICKDAPRLREDLVMNAVQDRMTIKRSVLASRRTKLHRDLRERVRMFREVPATAAGRPCARVPRVACVPRVAWCAALPRVRCVPRVALRAACRRPPGPLFSFHRTVQQLRACQARQSVRRSCPRRRAAVYCLIPVRAVVSRSSNVLALLGGLHQHHRLVAFARSSTFTLSRRVCRVRRCVCVLVARPIAARGHLHPPCGVGTAPRIRPPGGCDCSASARRGCDCALHPPPGGCDCHASTPRGCDCPASAPRGSRLPCIRPAGS